MASEVKLGSRFTDSKTYENVRPSYTREPVEFLLKKIGALNEDGTPCNREFKILELGAGTGKFTRVVMEVLEKNPNFQVIASEPLPEMCHKFKEVLPGVELFLMPLLTLFLQVLPFTGSVITKACKKYTEF
ncbi:uncharacterized protein LOC5514561 isoform X2 [Nematostella vectensis]|uniref:uncharacterized protein LOC5514561 isoform X2 n=1 Tax=Nematostella vectensis TaxID=45351 RepID=UPI00207746F9|nr:uncharacterized protein LOC5514561 isoform X2 [Nematostella vectensis]